MPFLLYISNCHALVVLTWLVELICFVDKGGLEICSLSARPSIFVDIYHRMCCRHVWYCTPGEWRVPTLRVLVPLSKSECESDTANMWVLGNFNGICTQMWGKHHQQKISLWHLILLRLTKPRISSPLPWEGAVQTFWLWRKFWKINYHSIQLCNPWFWIFKLPICLISNIFDNLIRSIKQIPSQYPQHGLSLYLFSQAYILSTVAMYFFHHIFPIFVSSLLFHTCHHLLFTQFSAQFSLQVQF